jgi:sulfite reductase (NADPH) hemoprotein beta-component
LTNDEIIEELTAVLRRYSDERESGERFGDFCIRAGYVKATIQGADFHN